MHLGLDIDGDGVIDFYQPRPAPLYYAKNLLPSLVLTLSVQLASAALFVAINDGEWTFGDGVYHCIVTASTVGYGDVSITTESARLFAVAHIFVSVVLLAELIATGRYQREIWH